MTSRWKFNSLISTVSPSPKGLDICGIFSSRGPYTGCYIIEQIIDAADMIAMMVCN